MNLKRSALIFLLTTNFAIAEVLPKETKDVITKHLENAQKRHGIFGQSLAILKDGELVYIGATGLANIEFGIPATPDTVYSIYSVTKLFISTRLLQLVEQEKLQLADTLGQHFPDIPDSWRSVTVLQVLSHVSGIPEYSLENMAHITGSEAVSNVANKPMEFEVGTKSSYNQTNFYYVQKLIEKFDAASLKETIGTNVITPFGLTKTSFGGEFDIILGRATRYEGTKNGNKRVMRNDPPPYYYAANGLNSSVIDIASWFRALLNEELISLNFLEKVWHPIALKDGRDAQHTHGWEYRKLNGYTAVGHYGANFVNVRHFFNDDIKKNTVTIIHLTNGRSKRFNHLDFSFTLASEIMQDMKTPIRTLKEDMLSALETDGFEQAKSTYFQFKADYPEQATKTEDMLNSLGYLSLFALCPELAIRVFELNTLEYPSSANAFDSLAEAHLEAGNRLKAKIYYQKALSLDKKNNRIKRILEQLD